MPKKILIKDLSKTLSRPQYREPIDLTMLNLDILVSSVNTEASVKQDAISMGTGTKSFSFKDNVKNNEFVQNPNIIEDGDYSKIKNTSISMVDKFTEQDDSFFDLDDDRELQVQASFNNKRLENKAKISKINKRVSITQVSDRARTKTKTVRPSTKVGVK